MLGANSEAEEVGGGGVEALEVGGHFSGIVKLVRDVGAVDGDCVRVVAVCGVDALEGLLVFRHCGGRMHDWMEGLKGEVRRCVVSRFDEDFVSGIVESWSKGGVMHGTKEG